jgi:hypothetical protein
MLGNKFMQQAIKPCHSRQLAQQVKSLQQGLITCCRDLFSNMLDLLDGYFQYRI